MATTGRYPRQWSRPGDTRIAFSVAICHFGGRPTMRKCFADVKAHATVWYARKRDVAEWTLERERPQTVGAAP
jgi:hypothetical protein